MNLGEQIYKLRTQRNLSQGDLADALDVSRQSISKWENNSAVPELDKLVKLSDVFGITLDELVKGTTPEPSPVDTPHRSASFPAHQIIGILALVLCFVAILVTYLAGNFFGIHPEEGVLLAMLFAVLGVICLKPGRRNPLLWYLPIGCIVLYIKSIGWLPYLWCWLTILIGIILIIWALLPRDHG